MSNIAIMAAGSNSASAAVAARKRKEEEANCKVFMSNYTDATASNQMKKTYASCVEKAVPKDFSPPSVEAKIAVTALFVGWIVFMIIGSIKMTMGAYCHSWSDRLQGALFGTITYIVVLIGLFIVVAFISFILA